MIKQLNNKLKEKEIINKNKEEENEKLKKKNEENIYL